MFLRSCLFKLRLVCLINFEEYATIAVNQGKHFVFLENPIPSKHFLDPNITKRG